MKKRHWLALIAAVSAALGSLLPGSPVPALMQQAGLVIVGN